MHGHWGLDEQCPDKLDKPCLPFTVLVNFERGGFQGMGVRVKAAARLERSALKRTREGEIRHHPLMHSPLPAPAHSLRDVCVCLPPVSSTCSLLSSPNSEIHHLAPISQATGGFTPLCEQPFSSRQASPLRSRELSLLPLISASSLPADSSYAGEPSLRTSTGTATIAVRVRTSDWRPPEQPTSELPKR